MMFNEAQDLNHMALAGNNNKTLKYQLETQMFEQMVKQMQINDKQIKINRNKRQFTKCKYNLEVAIWPTDLTKLTLPKSKKKYNKIGKCDYCTIKQIPEVIFLPYRTVKRLFHARCEQIYHTPHLQCSPSQPSCFTEEGQLIHYVL